MPAPVSTLIAVTTLDNVALADAKLTPNDAGRALKVVGGGKGAYKTLHLFGPNRMSAALARIEPDAGGLYRLPNPLPPGDYYGSIREAREEVGLSIKFAVGAVAAGSTTNPPAVPSTGTPNPLPGNPGGPPAKAVMEWGFAANDQDNLDGLMVALKRMPRDGGRWLRLWHGNFNAISTRNRTIIAAANSVGVGVILCVHPKDGGTEAFGRPDFARFAALNESTLRQVAYVEAGNELNLRQYRPDDMGGPLSWHGPYADRWLSPLGRALSPLGVKVLCASVTDDGNPDVYEQQSDLIARAGIPALCDAVALHAYVHPKKLPSLAPTLRAYSARVGKSLVLTEFGPHARTTPAADYAKVMAASVTAARDSGVVKAVGLYRGLPHPKFDFYRGDRALFDNAGNATALFAAVKGALA